MEYVACAWSGATTCAAKGKTKEVVRVSSGESFTFSTNSAATYGGNVRCLVTYRRTNSCRKIELSCPQFSLGRGDFLRVTRGKNKQT